VFAARFGRRARLATRADFEHVFAQSEKSSDRYFTVLARPNTLAFPRLGLAISKKAAKSAVVRNRIKRLVRESFRQRQPELGGLDVVVIARPNLANEVNATLSDSLNRHWTKLIQQRCAEH